MLGNYLPRKCGIATFTTDLARAIDSAFPNIHMRTMAMNDRDEGYDYPDEVVFELKEDSVEAYHQAADYLNHNAPDLICVQHEYGIFGGNGGDYLLTLLEQLNVPIVVTLHTVLTDPNDDHRRVMARLNDLADRFVVMSHKALSILKDVYGIANDAIAFIPHGIPDTPFVDPNYYKDQFGVMGRKLALTFGLLSPNKGIEYAIKALPKVVEQHPDILYLVLGATHPNIVRDVGEQYRESLKALVSDLGVEDNVMFCDQFVGFDELCEYLSAADVYVTPYVGEAQITSGTLAYAMGTGKPIVSTPYWYAEEMLANERGCLVPFKDSEAIADGILAYLNDDELKHRTRKNAYEFTRSARWPDVAASYISLFNEIVSAQSKRPRRLGEDILSVDDQSKELLAKPVKPKQLLALTDDTGMFQHARHTIADREHGYCTDDNARALLVTSDLLCDLYDLRDSQAASDRAPSNFNSSSNKTPSEIETLESAFQTYVSFLLDAYNPKTGCFRNFMSFDRRWLEETGSEDSQARAFWCAAHALNRMKGTRFQAILNRLFQLTSQKAGSFNSIRSNAFVILGAIEYLKLYPGDSLVKRLLKRVAQSLVNRFPSRRDQPEWPWPEDILAYDNARLPQALLAAAQVLNDASMFATGLECLDWLIAIQTEKSGFSPVGCDGWFVRGTTKARFDQQPLEAAAGLAACQEAIAGLIQESGKLGAALSNKKSELRAHQHVSPSQNASDPSLYSVSQWGERARMCFEWFLGRNDLGLSLIDQASQGCFDGLNPRGVNHNQGAESCLAWLQAHTDMRAVAAAMSSRTSGNKVTSISQIAPIVEHVNPEVDEDCLVALSTADSSTRTVTKEPT